MQCIINMHCIIFLYNSVTSTFVECNITNVPTVVCKIGNIVIVTVSGTLKTDIAAWSSVYLSHTAPKAKEQRYNSLLISQDTTDPRILLSATGTDIFIESKGPALNKYTWTFGQLVYACE